MCDLWKYTLEQATAPGALIDQIRIALKSKTEHRWIKLYNASNFFEPRAVPTIDLGHIAELCNEFERVVVESHPRLVSKGVEEFRDGIAGSLEIAMGLETIHPESFQWLQKEFTLIDFERSNMKLEKMGIDRRAFVMLQPPGTQAFESVDWVMRTLAFASDCGVRHCSIIPTRLGNGTMERFESQGLFRRPKVHQLEACLDLALQRFPSMIVTADLWDLHEMDGHCSQCFEARRTRMESMNLQQRPLPKVALPCGCSVDDGQ
jgi:archaeosine synthase beta-subunit